MPYSPGVVAEREGSNRLALIVVIAPIVAILVVVVLLYIMA